MPTKLVHYPLPLYGAVAWLAAAALTEPLGARARWIGASLSAVFGLLLAGACFYLVKLYGDLSDLPVTVLTAGLLAAAGLVGGWLLVRRSPPLAAATALGLGMLGHAALAAGIAPRLQPLWLSARTEAALERAQLLPDQGIAAAPVTVAGYAEPSLVFAVGTATELGGPEDAAQAIAEGRPAVVEAREEAAFRQALSAARTQARLVAAVKGLDYSDGKTMTLRIYQSAATEPTSSP